MFHRIKRQWALKPALLLTVISAIFLLTLSFAPVTSTQAFQTSPTPTPTLIPPDDSSETKPAQAPAKVTQDDQPPPESLELLETLTVPADGTLMQTSFNLDEGVEYVVRVSGVYKWGNCDPVNCPNGAPDYIRQGDAEYLTDDNWQSFSDPFWSTFIYLEVNGSDPDFGPFNPNHIYNIQLVGNDQPATFRIQDCSYCYPDNTGALTVEILREKQVEVDLSISDVKPIQVVEDPDVNGDGVTDLVLDKPMVVRVYINVENAGALDPDQVIEVELNFQGSVLTENRTISQLLAGPVDFFPTPRDLGNSTILVTVDPKNLISETNETNNQPSPPPAVTVKDTNLYIVHIPVTFEGPLNEYEDTVKNGGKFIEAVYPVARDRFTNQRVDSSFKRLPLYPLSFLSGPIGLSDDLQALWAEGWILSLGRADRIVGVAPQEYFDFRFPVPLGCSSIVAGASIPGINASVVLEGHWTAAAHEIGHTYGFKIEGYDTEPTGPCGTTVTKPGDPATSYWIERWEELGEPHDTLDFMGISPGEHSFERWVTPFRFVHLFDKLRVNKSDPEVLLVSGLVHPDGQVEMRPLYRVDEGFIDEIPPGDHSLQQFDAQGNLIQEISFSVASTIFVNPFPPIELDTGAFAFAIPYPENTQELRILREGVLITDIVVTTQLLRDAVDAIPDFGFDKNPDQRRNTLHNKIDALEEQIRAGAFTGAVNKLQNDIRPSLERWLVGDYQKENVLQYSKEEILALVDEMIERLDAAD